MMSGSIAIAAPRIAPSASRLDRNRRQAPLAARPVVICQIYSDSSSRDVTSRALNGRRLRWVSVRTTPVSNAKSRSEHVRTGTASIPIGGTSPSDADASGGDPFAGDLAEDVGTPPPREDGSGNSTLEDIAPEPKSNFLRSIGITNGVLGVSQDRVEMVAKQALPVMGGMASQNVLNLADSAMVGRLGTACVAAVGISSTLNFQCQAALQGISSGVQAMSARRIGEGKSSIAAVPLNAALMLCLLFGIPMATWAYTNAPMLVDRLTADPEVIKHAVQYLQARLAAVPAVGINFAFRGFWNAAQQPQIYMNTLLIMHAVNIGLSLALIFGVPALGVPAMGVVGAGIGTSFSVWVGSALYLRMGFQRAKHMGFGCCFPSANDFKVLLKQAAPTSGTNLLFATGMAAMYWIVGQLGTAETAAVNVLINLMLTLVLPCMGMGLAAGALSGRALGRGDVDDATQWPWDVAKLTAALMFGVGLIAVLIPEVLLKVFLTNEDAIRVATWPLRFTGITVAGDALSLTMQNALLGVGDAARVAMVSIGTQWLLFLPAAYFGVTRLGFDLNWMWGLYVGQRVLQAVIYAAMWRDGKWRRIKLS